MLYRLLQAPADLPLTFLWIIKYRLIVIHGEAFGHCDDVFCAVVQSFGFQLTDLLRYTTVSPDLEAEFDDDWIDFQSFAVVLFVHVHHSVAAFAA